MSQPVRACVGCGAELPPMTYQGNPRKWCSGTCRARTVRAQDIDRARRIQRQRAREKSAKSRPCKVCGGRLPTDRPHFGYCSDACRWLVRFPGTTQKCDQCGQGFTSRAKGQKFCSRACYGLACRTDTPKDPYYKRAVKAPGLSDHGRWALLAKWKRQRRTCTYCDAPCQAVDHVIPLQRGGTNYEGNLTPCCTACNSRKSHATIMEWRMGKKPARTYSPRAPRKPKPSRVPELRLVLDVACCICGQAFTQKTRRGTTCSARCLAEKNARKARDAYRAAHGLPVDPGQPTKPTRRAS